jgi:transposase InsO family protein
VQTVLHHVAAAQSTTGLSARQLCPRVPLSRATLGRWQRRQRCGQPLVRRPGPAKTPPLPLALVEQQIRGLTHGRHRTQGTGALYQQHRQHLSRRDLGELVQEARQRHQAELHAQGQHITWFCSQTVWALDATEWKTVPAGPKVQVLAFCDLATRYGLGLQAQFQLEGHQVADGLAQLIRQFGAPLFLKRDNGAVLRTPDVQAVLAQAGILPLDSPPYYPPYNGGIERYISEVKHALPEGLPCPRSGDLHPVQACLHGVRHHLNAQPRPVLQGDTPTEMFSYGPRLRVAKPERLAIYHLLWEQTRRSVAAMERVNQRSIQAAWRHAAQSWLRDHRLITLNTNNQNHETKTQLLPLFSPKWSH